MRAPVHIVHVKLVGRGSYVTGIESIVLKALCCTSTATKVRENPHQHQQHANNHHGSRRREKLKGRVHVFYLRQ